MELGERQAEARREKLRNRGMAVVVALTLIAIVLLEFLGQKPEVEEKYTQELSSILQMASISPAQGDFEISFPSKVGEVTVMRISGEEKVIITGMEKQHCQKMTTAARGRSLSSVDRQTDQRPHEAGQLNRKIVKIACLGTTISIDLASM